MNDSNGKSEKVTYRDLAAPLAEKAAEAARNEQENREILRDDPEFTDARWWLAEDRGEKEELGRSIAELHNRFTRDGMVDVGGFAEWLRKQHVETNEWRSDATGRVERVASGQHHGSAVALDVLRDVTGLEYDDIWGEDHVA